MTSLKNIDFVQMFIQVKDIKIIRMNRASMTIEFNGYPYLITRRLFNSIIQESDRIIVFVIEKEYRGIKSKWLALPSIF